MSWVVNAKSVHIGSECTVKIARLVSSLLTYQKVSIHIYVCSACVSFRLH